MPPNQIYFSRYFNPSKADGCVCPGNNAFPIFINVLTETGRFDRKFSLDNIEFYAVKDLAPVSRNMLTV